MKIRELTVSPIGNSRGVRLRVRCAGKEADIALDQIRVLGKSRLIRRIDRLSTSAGTVLRRLISEM
ncbi:MAG: hypothetical protein FJ404_09085 [Verrucomicrobia bacterium]|nr:hypothetical protein [Verrucomicrobiota bacterium]